MKPSFIGIDELDLSQKLSSNVDNPDFYSKYQIVARVVDGSNEHSVWRHSRDYLTCFISIRDCRIKSCFAKGWGQSGDGGAVSALNSQLKIENDIFEKNEANSGGSIAAYNSNVLITRTLFSNDVGYVSAGSLLVTGNLNYQPPTQDSPTTFHSDVPSTTDPYFCQIYDSAFEGSYSFELYGAAFFNSIPEIYFRNVTFSKCHTGTSGGAVGFVDSSVYIFKSVFKDNYCSKNSWSNKLASKTKVHFTSLARGGGAIFYTAQNQPEDYWNFPPLIELVTQECTFSCNYVDGLVHPLSPQKNPGFDILFYKYSMYRSYYDHFTYPKETSVAIYPDEILRMTQFNEVVANTCGSSPQDHWTNTNAVYSSDILSLTQGGEINPPTPSEVITLPPTRLPPVTTRSHFVHSRPSVLTATHSRKIQSPTPSHSRTPTCSTYGETPRPVKYRTNIETVTHSFYWEVDPTKNATTLPSGQTWPAQSTVLSPTKSFIGYLPDGNRPTQSWWGEYPNPRPTASISFYGELSATREPEAYPTNLGTAWFGQSYKTLTITNSKTLTVTFYTTKMYSYSEQPIPVESYVKGQGEDGTYYRTLSLTERVLYDGVAAKETIITQLYISVEYSALTPTQTTDKYEIFVENPTKTETVTFVQRQTYTIVISNEESLVYTMLLVPVCDEYGSCDEGNLTWTNTQSESIIGHPIAASVYIYVPSETVLDIIMLSRKQKVVPRTPIDTGVILGIAIAICALIFGITIGILFMRRRNKREQAKLAEEMGDQFDFSGASDEDIIDDNDGVTATIDVPSEDLNQTFDEADNWI